ncbi:hypothetical protein SESBI_13292 [Sesbania bispinosa]|nr:hypothetical protein SESBI_13292 [Sesbania bispinosa]
MENECVNLSDDNVFEKIDGEEVVGGKGEGEEGVSGKVHGEEDVGGKVDGEEEYKKMCQLTSEDIQGLEFGSEEEAYEFYSNYARCHGFAVDEGSRLRLALELTMHSYNTIEDVIISKAKKYIEKSKENSK